MCKVNDTGTGRRRFLNGVEAMAWGTESPFEGVVAFDFGIISWTRSLASSSNSSSS